MADAPEPRPVSALPAKAGGTDQLERESATTIPVRRRSGTRERAAINKAGSYANLDIDHGFAWEGDGRTATDEPRDFTPPSWIKRSRRRRVFARVRNELAWAVALGVVLLITALAATAMLGPPDNWGPVLTLLRYADDPRRAKGPARTAPPTFVASSGSLNLNWTVPTPDPAAWNDLINRIVASFGAGDTNARSTK